MSDIFKTSEILRGDTTQHTQCIWLSIDSTDFKPANELRQDGSTDDIVFRQCEIKNDSADIPDSTESDVFINPSQSQYFLVKSGTDRMVICNKLSSLRFALPTALGEGEVCLIQIIFER